MMVPEILLRALYRDNCASRTVTKHAQTTSSILKGADRRRLFVYIVEQRGAQTCRIPKPGSFHYGWTSNVSILEALRSNKPAFPKAYLRGSLSSQYLHEKRSGRVAEIEKAVREPMPGDSPARAEVQFPGPTKITRIPGCHECLAGADCYAGRSEASNKADRPYRGRTRRPPHRLIPEFVKAAEYLAANPPLAAPSGVAERVKFIGPGKRSYMTP